MSEKPKLFNMEMMSEAYGGDETITKMMLEELIKNAGECILSLEECIEKPKTERPLKEIRDVVHKLKGSVR